MATNLAKKHYEEVEVNVFIYDEEDVITTSAYDGVGVYGNFNDWGGLNDTW